MVFSSLGKKKRTTSYSLKGTIIPLEERKSSAFLHLSVIRQINRKPNTTLSVTVVKILGSVTQ